ncbi:unnamed protein product [Phyllotreta striolata]|uniref:Uncharacterized protein n=1 Tax=Phyllotreta striolata TaxID=444603 RepID=A0A9N9XM26_PHYSR|nr:unnamed protein product [Phyllotreta striolata]
MIDILSAFLGPKLVLQAAGRWPEKNTTFGIKFREFISDFIEILLCLFSIAEIMYLLDDYVNLYDHMSLCFTLFGHLVKILIFRVYSKNWLEIFDQCKSKHFNDYPAEFDYILRKNINFTVHFGNSFITACVVAAAMYAIVPMLSAVDLPIRCSIFSQEYRAVVYTFQTISLLVCASTNSSIEAVTMNAISICVGQLSILVEKIKSFNMVDKRIDIFECIKHHNEIIRFVGNVEAAISKIVLVEYLKSILVLCFLGFQLIHVILLE